MIRVRAAFPDEEIQWLDQVTAERRTSRAAVFSMIIR